MAYPTTYKTLQDAVMSKLRLEDHAGSTDRARVKDWLNQGQALLVAETEYLQDCWTLALVANEPTYTLPATPQRIKQVIARAATVGSGYGPPLRELSLDEILGYRQASTVVATQGGTAEGYALVGDQKIEFWPTPTSADTVKVYATVLPTPMVADADVPAIREPYVKGIEYFALAEAADQLKDPGWQDYSARFEDYLRRLRIDKHRRSSVGAFQIRAGVPQVPLYDRSADLGGW